MTLLAIDHTIAQINRELEEIRLYRGLTADMDSRIDLGDLEKVARILAIITQSLERYED